MAKIKSIKVKQADGTYGTAIDIGVNAKNVDFTDKQNLETKINTINTNIKNKVRQAASKEDALSKSQSSPNDLFYWIEEEV